MSLWGSRASQRRFLCWGEGKKLAGVGGGEGWQ